MLGRLCWVSKGDEPLDCMIRYLAECISGTKANELLCVWDQVVRVSKCTGQWCPVSGNLFEFDLDRVCFCFVSQIEHLRSKRVKL